jgi:Family of unknown function (DUF6399)
VSTADSTVPAPAAQPARWHRAESASHLDAFTAAFPTSQRQFARQQGVPRTTLQHWLGRKAALDADPVAAAFLESAQGLAFVHRLLTAAHLVFTQEGPCGIRHISHFLRLTRLDRVVASSYGAQQQYAATLERGVVTFGKDERARLAPGMAPREISVCQDETFHPQICLVAIEPVSNFLLLEQYAERRDAATWTAAMKPALEGLAVTVVQSVGDEAKGLLAHARDGLGVPHGPDLFHVQHELCKGTAPVLAAQTRRAQQRVADAQTRVDGLRSQQQQAAGQPRRPGRPIDYPMWLEEAETCWGWEARQLAATEGRQTQMREAIRGLGSDYHPFDLIDGTPQDAGQVAGRLEARFATIERLAAEAELPERCLARIAKARRVLGGLVAALAFFWVRVQAMTASWPAALAAAWRGGLLAGHYLRRVAGKAAGAEQRAALRALSARCLGGGEAGGPAAEEATARQCATWFQRSSSCVEGRNGQLELRHHSLHRLSPRKLAALTTIHNYWLKRADGRTAAERFFGAKPTDLFAWLLERQPLPARPARRRPRAA